MGSILLQQGPVPYYYDTILKSIEYFDISYRDTFSFLNSVKNNYYKSNKIVYFNNFFYPVNSQN